METPPNKASAAASDAIPPLQLNPEQHGGNISAPAPEQQRSIDTAATLSQPIDVLPTTDPIADRIPAAPILASTPSVSPAQPLRPTIVPATDAASDDAMEVDPHGLDDSQMDLGLDKLQPFDGGVNPNMDLDPSEVKSDDFTDDFNFGALDADETPDDEAPDSDAVGAEQASRAKPSQAARKQDGTSKKAQGIQDFSAYSEESRAAWISELMFRELNSNTLIICFRKRPRCYQGVSQKQDAH